MISQKNSSADTYGCAYGRKSVAPVMPRIGHHCPGVQFLSPKHRIAVERLLKGDGHQRRYQCQHSRLLQRTAVKKPIDRRSAVPENSKADKKQYNTDNGGCQSLIFTMPVIVSLIFRLGRDAHKDNDDDVRNKVRQRVYGICQHGGAMPRDSRKELKQKQQEVHHTPHNRYAVNCPAPQRSGCPRRTGSWKCPSWTRF